MQIEVKPVKLNTLHGTVAIPASKSHTIRCIIFASLADGESLIENPLKSADGLAPINGCELLGARIEWQDNNTIIVHGTGGSLNIPSNVILVGNSGTTMNLMIGTCSLIQGTSVLSGDSSTNNRSVQPLLDALNMIGAKCTTTRSTGTPPVLVTGKITGGKAKIVGAISQFTSSLLLSTPLAENDTEITTIGLQEKPYVQMTCDYLDMLGLKGRYDIKGDFEKIYINGGQHYHSFKKTVPADFSSAAFLLGAAVLCGHDVHLTGLDIMDSQADKQLIAILKVMGADITINNKEIIINQSLLEGGSFDLSQCPDLLPILSVIATQAKGETNLKNIQHARLKETDRITIMSQELKKLGADIRERQDSLTIKKSQLHGGKVNGYYDHRVVMALAVAGLITTEPLIIDTAEAINITFPDFIEKMTSLNASMNMSENKK